MKLWVYRCKNKSCRKNRYFHHTSKMPKDVRLAMDRKYKIVDVWENEGGSYAD